MHFFVTEAVADTGTVSQSNPYSLIVMLVVFCLIFYFIILRPQQIRAKTHKKLMDSVAQGDEILTTSGLVGHVVKVLDTNYLTVALNENNEVILRRDSIAAILPKGTIKAL